MKHTGKMSAAAAVIASLLLGCETKVAPKPVPAPHVFALPNSQVQATSELVTATRQFDQAVEQMPGSGENDHRQILVAVLDQLPRILRLANGKEESPELHNRLSVIEAGRSTINDSSVDRSRMEAVENQCLQAAAPALAEIVSKYLYDDDQLPPLLQAMTDKIDTAAGSTGPMHDLDAGEAFAAMQAVVDRMTSDLSDRFLGNAQ